jgi:aspartyl protease family protein
MKTVVYCIAVAGIWLLSDAAWATSVGVVGLFRDKAVIRVDGGQPKMLRAGQSLGSVKLISASSESAVMFIDGVRRTLSLGQSFAGGVGSQESQTAVLFAQPNGHFFTEGSLNGVPVTFLLDTGATAIVIGKASARQMNVEYDSTSPVAVQTAAGVKKAWKVIFGSVRVGSIEINQVDGLVVDANSGPVLLGMSFLGRTDMKREGQTLTLTRRY